MGSVALLPSRIEPKFRETGERTRVDGVAVPSRLMKSSEVLESEEISIALTTVVDVCEEATCGVKVMVMGQLAPATMTGQEPVMVKSGEAVRDVMWMVDVPVFASVMVWGADALPPEVAANVSELCEAVKETSGAALPGEATKAGVVVPVRSTMSGLEVASLSMTSDPESVLKGAGDEPVAAWLSGA